jgi:hypothetical protein
MTISRLDRDHFRRRAALAELRKANQGMAGKLYQLQGAKDLAENDRLKEQLRGSER